MSDLGQASLILKGFSEVILAIFSLNFSILYLSVCHLPLFPTIQESLPIGYQGSGIAAVLFSVAWLSDLSGVDPQSLV